MKIHHRLWLKSPKVWIPGLLILIIVFLVGLWFGAANQWQQRAETSSKVSKQAVELKNQVLSDKINREGHYKAIATLAKVKPVTCEGDWWSDWQRTVWTSSAGAKKTCLDANKRIEQLSGAAKVLQGYLDDEQRIINQLATLTIDKKAKNWQTTAASASATAFTELSSLKLADTVEPVLKEATKRVKELSDAWKALDTADAKKDRTAYEAALNRLDDAYAQLASITEVSDAALKEQLEALSGLR